MTEKKRFVRGIAAFALVFAAGFTACDNGTTPEDEKEKTGEKADRVLEIVETKVYETAGLYIGTADTPQSGVSDLLASFNWIKNNAKENGIYVIALGAGETVTAESGTAIKLNSAAVNNKTGVTIVLTGANWEQQIKLSTTTQGRLFSISGLRLVLGKHITLMGRSGNNDALVVVGNGGELKMLADSKITGNNNSNINSSGGVHVYGGTFTMRGGEIYGNTSNGDGGGVHVYEGTFTMHGGKIYGNTSNVSGGGVSTNTSGTFTMHGGKIYGNTASGIYGGGGGVYVYGYTFTMTGGEIYENTGSRSGGGVFVHQGRFTMTGGEIYGNKAKHATAAGGGVCLYHSYHNDVFKKTGGVIYGNDAIEEKRNKVTLADGNTPLPNYGDAVYVFGITSSKRRETSALAGDNLDSTTASGWE